MAAKPTQSPSKGSTDRWENEGGPSPVAEVPPGDGVQPDLDELGITPVQLTVFDCSGYRYNLGDAIAASKRATKASAS